MFHGNVRCPNPEILSKERERDLIWMFINAIKYHVELGAALWSAKTARGKNYTNATQYAKELLTIKGKGLWMLKL